MSISQSEIEKIVSLSSCSQEEFNQILNEKILDAWLIKCFIQIENKVGVLLILVSELSYKILTMYSVFGTSTAIRKIQVFEKFLQFASDMVSVVKGGGVEFPVSERIGRTIYRVFLPEEVEKVIANLKNKKFEPITTLFTQGIVHETKLTNVQIELDVEKINSAYFAKKNPIYGVIPEVRSPFEEISNISTSFAKSTSSTTAIPKTKVEIAIEEFIKDYREVVKCSTVVAPVSGVLFEELKPGQKLLFLLPNKTPEEKSRARRLGAVNQLGQSQPIIGEFLKLIVGKDEYHIFAKGPGNVLLRAFEPRPVRLAIPTNLSSSSEEKNFKVMVYISAGFFLFVLVLLLLYFL